MPIIRFTDSRNTAKKRIFSMNETRMKRGRSVRLSHITKKLKIKEANSYTSDVNYN